MKDSTLLVLVLVVMAIIASTRSAVIERQVSRDENMAATEITIKQLVDNMDTLMATVINQRQNGASDIH